MVDRRSRVRNDSDLTVTSSYFLKSTSGSDYQKTVLESGKNAYI